MEFEKVECISAFYDEYTGDVFYIFDTQPPMDDPEWAISEGGDLGYHLLSDRITPDYPEELTQCLGYIPDNIEIEGL